MPNEELTQGTIEFTEATPNTHTEENTFVPTTQIPNVVAGLTPVNTEKRGRKPKETTTTTKKPRVPKVLARTIPEIIDEAPAKLTEGEKIALIEHLREEVAFYSQQNMQLSKNCESAFEQARKMREEIDASVKAENAKKQFLRQALSTYHQTVLLTLEG
jgi:hypothetical protein